MLSTMQEGESDSLMQNADTWPHHLYDSLKVHLYDSLKVQLSENTFKKWKLIGEWYGSTLQIKHAKPHRRNEYALTYPRPVTIKFKCGSCSCSGRQWKPQNVIMTPCWELEI